ncbi:MAG: aldo/keto reductase [Armatimonadota bacterium]|jgi:aryl-alcohol dehydrogenase-like predicted oxidoreductase
MEKRPCGKSGIDVSVVGIGAWAYGGGEDDYWGAQDQTDVEAVVNAALDRGINYFDTAEAYNGGRSEESLGRALGPRRHEAIIGSKISPNNTEPSVLREHCDASLRRLGTDYIDIYFVHWPIAKHPVQDAFDTLAALQSEGKIRSIAVSNFGARDLTEALETGARIDVNQLCYNLVSRAIEFEIVPLCRQHDIAIFPYMPLLQGILSGKYAALDDIPPERTRTRQFSGDRPQSRHGGPGAEDEMIKVLDGMREISDETGIPMDQLALAWTAAKPGVASVLVGVRNIEQLERNAPAADVHLSADLVARLDELTAPMMHTLGPNADYFQGPEGSRVH